MQTTTTTTTTTTDGQDWSLYPLRHTRKGKKSRCSTGACSKNSSKKYKLVRASQPASQPTSCLSANGPLNRVAMLNTTSTYPPPHSYLPQAWQQASCLLQPTATGAERSKCPKGLIILLLLVLCKALYGMGEPELGRTLRKLHVKKKKKKAMLHW